VTLSAYVLSLDDLYDAHRGGPAAERVRQAFEGPVPELVERWLLGKPIRNGLETVDLMEQVASAIGWSLSNASFGTLRMRGVEAVDAALAAAGIAKGFRVDQLIMGDCPIKELPGPPAPPSMGYVKPDALAAASLQFEQEAPTSDDDDVDSVLAEMDDWFTVYRRLQAKVERPLGLLGFYFG
jgi:hypothetical protein